MKTWNIWIFIAGANFPPTGPWKFYQAVVASSKLEALRIATSRTGFMPKDIAVYEGLGVC